MYSGYISQNTQCGSYKLSTAARLRAEVKKRDRQSVLSIDDLLQNACSSHNDSNAIDSQEASVETTPQATLNTRRPSQNATNPLPITCLPTASTIYTRPKAIRINNSTPKTTNHRPKPRTLPPLSQPPLPRPIRTCSSSSSNPTQNKRCSTNPTTP